MNAMFEFVLTGVDGVGIDSGYITVIVVDRGICFTSFTGSSRAGVIK